MSQAIYDYTDYRRFLKDRYLEIKAKKPFFSYRYFNRITDIKSSSFLNLVMNGSRNLGEEGIKAIIKGFELTQRQAAYFKALVLFNQAKTYDQKEQYFSELRKYNMRAKKITQAQYDLFSHWYYVTILELINLETKQVKDIEWILENIYPSVGRREVKKALKSLLKLKLIKVDAHKNYVPVETMIATPDEFESLSIINFHKEMCLLAERGVEEIHPDDREFSSLTIATTEEGMQLAKKEIQEFRKKLHSLLEQKAKGPKKVVAQINLQLFRSNRKLK